MTNAFAEALKNRAQETGRVVIQGESAGAVKVEKAEDKNIFAAKMQARQAEIKAEVSAPAPKIDIDAKVDGLIKTWSISSLHEYEGCPGRLRQKKHPEKDQRWEEPKSPQAERGTHFHDGAENFVRGNTDELWSDRKMKLEPFMADFEMLKAKFAEGSVSLEEDWAFRIDWSPCGWFDDDVWGRGKLDFFIRESATSCVIGDYKTGGRWNNTVKHSDQGVSYALQAYHRYPEMEHFRVEFWYVDEGTKMIRNFTRRMLSVLLMNLHKRAVKATSDKVMHFKPNRDSCRFCCFGRNTNKQGVPCGNGNCEEDFYAKGGY